MKQIFVVMSVPKFVKLSGGLTGHKNTKHSYSRSSSGVPVSSETIIEKKLHADVLLRIVSECAESCFNDLCLPQESRDYFSKKHIVFTSEDSLQLLQKLKYIVEDFSGDAEKFYSGFYGLLLDNLLPSKFEDQTVTDILMTEAANHIFIHLSGGSDISVTSTSFKKVRACSCRQRFFKVYNILLVTLFTKCIQSSSFQIIIKVIIVSKRCQF